MNQYEIEDEMSVRDIRMYLYTHIYTVHSNLHVLAYYTFKYTRALIIYLCNIIITYAVMHTYNFAIRIAESRKFFIFLLTFKLNLKLIFR